MGTLVWHDRRAWFEFDSQFLDLGFNPSPLLLEKTIKPQPAQISHFGGLHSVFHDCLPDGWGRFIMDRYFAQCGVPSDEITPLDRLAFIADRGMGALSFDPPHPMTPTKNSSDPFDLTDAASTARDLYEGLLSRVSRSFASNGTPAAGGQPKLLIGYNGTETVEGSGLLPDDFSHWLVKISPAINPNVQWAGTIEYVYALLAQKAGILMSGVRLVRDEDRYSYFLTRRFDRKSLGQRVFVQSASALLNVDSRNAELDYSDLLKLSDILTRNYAQKLFLFRQMVFNIISGNRDDNLRNFAFMLAENDEWSCTPACGISWNTGMAGKHAMSVNGHRKDISRNDVLEVAKRSSITKRDATAILDRVGTTLRSGESLLREHGVSNHLSQDIIRYVERQQRAMTPASAVNIETGSD